MLGGTRASWADVELNQRKVDLRYARSQPADGNVVVDDCAENPITLTVGGR